MVKVQWVLVASDKNYWWKNGQQARLAQSVEHQTLNLAVAGSSPASGLAFALGQLYPKKFQFRPKPRKRGLQGKKSLMTMAKVQWVLVASDKNYWWKNGRQAPLAQSVEHQTLNLAVAGSSPASGLALGQLYPKKFQFPPKPRKRDKRDQQGKKSLMTMVKVQWVLVASDKNYWWKNGRQAPLAQSVEHQTLNLAVAGSSPASGLAFALGQLYPKKFQFRPKPRRRDLQGKKSLMTMVKVQWVLVASDKNYWWKNGQQARLAQSVEHQTLNLAVAGSSPASGLALGQLYPKKFQFRPKPRRRDLQGKKSLMTMVKVQ
ncbi:hypothetical protein Aduo_001098 [Ancylostoma duodenale]